ncbi:GNAT family N-acetyltransferase [Gloeothece verrucosa]|uniref:GCN5-related N-acetyltransferase n=1 Tax=Gloeothece verrucosa (strain PCC 7822) TaxID=497965 RepID=E0UK79_GLOV7|nr:GNAT family N-acetyltransferase [Gloeothece verrucosa]ADN15841.1 GCN5-related N-acetyltransferase [Gloeothece verrucosa PCC 7822]
MEWNIRLANLEDFPQIHQLIKQVFEENSKYEMTEEGQKNFLLFIQTHELISRSQNGAEFWVCEADAKIVGVIEFAYYNHIYLYFVEKNYRGQGVGKALFNQIKTRVKGDITANSTAYALPVYLKLGFVQNGKLFTRKGISAYPVMYKRD